MPRLSSVIPLSCTSLLCTLLKNDIFLTKTFNAVFNPFPLSKVLVALETNIFSSFSKKKLFIKATEFLLNLHLVKIRQIVLTLSKIILLKDQIVSENMLRPTETLLIWFLAYYYVNLPTLGLDRERCSLLDNQF